LALQRRGVITHKFLVKGNDTVFKLSVSGKITGGSNDGCPIAGDEMQVDVSKAPRWVHSSWTYITLKALVGSYKKTIKLTQSNLDAWKNDVHLEGGVDYKIISITGSGGKEWSHDDTTAQETVMEWTLKYYTGGWEVADVK
jgi:hypothetical protein